MNILTSVQIHPVSIWPKEYTRSVDICYLRSIQTNSTHWTSSRQLILETLVPGSRLLLCSLFLWESSLKVQRVNGRLSHLYSVFEPSTTTTNSLSTRKKKAGLRSPPATSLQDQQGAEVWSPGTSKVVTWLGTGD